MTNINVAGELLFAFLRGKWIEDSGKSAYAKATADKCSRRPLVWQKEESG